MIISCKGCGCIMDIEYEADGEESDVIDSLTELCEECKEKSDALKPRLCQRLERQIA